MNSLDNDRLIYFFLREILGPSAYGVIKLSVFPGAKKKQKNKKKSSSQTPKIPWIQVSCHIDEGKINLSIA